MDPTTKQSTLQTIAEYGLLGVVAMVLGYVVLKLWKHGEDKAAVALKERDELREEREAMRLSHQKALDEMRLTHQAEMSKVRHAHANELQTFILRHHQELASTRASCDSERIATIEAYAEKSDKLVEKVTVMTTSLDSTLSRFLDRLTVR
jgi:hypothetical protein